MHVRKFSGPKLLIASGNKGKVKEIEKYLSTLPVTILPLPKATPVTAPEETGATFKENAALKARYYSQHLDLPCLADDSGLTVDALNGQPGIYSARWSTDKNDFSSAIKKVETLLHQHGLKSSAASFVCAVSLGWPDGHTETFEGMVHGMLTFPPRGTKGFGYDPIFIPSHHNLTFGEMTAAKKRRLSHRTAALKQLVAACF